MTLVAVCADDDVEEGGSAGFRLETQDGPLRLMVIRKCGALHVYVNVCPHRRLPLDFHPGRFLTEDGRHILCTNHIALFRLEDGVCVDGPCRGQALQPVPYTVKGGVLFVTVGPERQA
ncbi:MAG: Rieske 2Fe-2S domain-containing protein [Rhodospirillales bacterium]|nr:Rieske 2Fe-2S domain-containing protein [Rhodospirillales bacterium]